MDGSVDGGRSLGWDWMGLFVVVALTVAVRLGALLRTPGTPDCYPHGGARLLVGVLRLAAGRRRG